jgi:hypothetical protein
MLAGDRAMSAWATRDYLRRLLAAGHLESRGPAREQRELGRLGHYLLGAMLFLRYRRLESDTEPLLRAEANRNPVVMPN